MRLFQSRNLRKIFGPRRMEDTGDWRKLHNEQHDMCSSPNFIWMRWKGDVAFTGRKVMHTRF